MNLSQLKISLFSHIFFIFIIEGSAKRHTDRLMCGVKSLQAFTHLAFIIIIHFLMSSFVEFNFRCFLMHPSPSTLIYLMHSVTSGAKFKIKRQVAVVSDFIFFLKFPSIFFLLQQAACFPFLIHRVCLVDALEF